MKKRFIAEIIVCIMLVAAIVAVIIGNKDNLGKDKKPYDDGVERIDIDSIYLGNSDVQVEFKETAAVEL